MLGLGMASIIATGFLWSEQRVRVTSKVGLGQILEQNISYLYNEPVEVSAVFVISALLGGKLFPVLVGNLVEAWPCMLHYLCLILSAACLLSFSLANIIYR